MSVDIRELGQAIRSARMRRGITQEALAEMLDITPIHLKNIEGSRRKPSVPLLFQMMEILDFSVDVLVFQTRQDPVIHTGGLTEAEAEAVARLVDVMRRRNLRPADPERSYKEELE